MSTPAGSTSTTGIACAARGVREIFAVEASFVPRFVVANAPLLTPLAAAVNGMPDSLVVFVDGESVRLIPFGIEGAGEGVALESDVPGHHRQGGWALLAQARYQRHIQHQRGRHFEAVAQAVAHGVESRPIARMVVAGTSRNAAAFRTHLPPALAARVVGPVAAARHESDSVIVERAMRLLMRLGNEAKATEAGGETSVAKKRPHVMKRR